METREDLFDLLTIDLSINLPSEIGHQSFFAKILLDTNTIGQIELTKINAWSDSLEENFDYSSELFTIYGYLNSLNIIEEDIADPDIDDFVILQRIFLKEKYQGLGLGGQAIKILINYFEQITNGLFCLKSFPLQYCSKSCDDFGITLKKIDDPDFNKELNSLNTFYKKLPLQEMKVDEGSFFYKYF